MYRILQTRLELNRSLALDDQQRILKEGRKRTNFHEEISLTLLKRISLIAGEAVGHWALVQQRPLSCEGFVCTKLE